MNKIQMLGRLTKDPDIKTIVSAVNNEQYTLCNFILAVDKKGQDKKTNFFRCVAWNKVATFMGQYLHKGNRIVITGYLEVNEWEKDGKKRYEHLIVAEEVYFADSKDNADKVKEIVKENEATAELQQPQLPEAEKTDDVEEGLPFNQYFTSLNNPARE